MLSSVSIAVTTTSTASNAPARSILPSRWVAQAGYALSVAKSHYDDIILHTDLLQHNQPDELQSGQQPDY